MEVLQRTANRGSISTGYDIDNSLKLEGNNSERLYFTPASAGNRKTWTVSLWFKRTDNGYSMMFGTADTYVYLDTNGGAMHIRLDQSGLSGSTYLYTTAQYRDTSAWYHFVLAVDTTQSTASDRAKFYVNGVQETSFTTETYPTQNIDTDWNFTNAHYVGGWTGAAYDSSGYMAEVHSVDGQQLAPTEFGEFDEDTGIWKPKEYTGTYGTNGFYLEFKNSADLGDDTSGNNKNFVLNNITSADQATDTPTNNFCTLNYLIPYGYPTTISEGSVKGVDNSSGLGGAAGTIAVNSGKWYWEFKSSVSTTVMGIQDIEADTSTSNNAHEIAYTMGVYLLGEYNYAKDPTGRNDGSTSGLIFDADKRYAVALNLDDDEITYYQTGSSVGTFSLDGLAGLYVRPFASCAGTLQWNFGGYTTIGSYSNSDENGYGNFEYTPPSGYYALCTKNLAEYG